MLRLAAFLAGVAAAFAAAPDKCPAGYTAFQGRCFKYNGSPKNWANAQAQCQLEDANLASFADQDDFDFLWALCVGNECWLGGNDQASEGNFKFVGSNALVPSGYWSTNQPDNANGNQDCIWLWLAEAPEPKIDDLGCTASRRFLCERPTGCGAGEYRHSANECRNCPAGKYQPSISVNGISDCINCAAGRYGTSTKETNPQCTGICAQRYYCPSGSTSATAFRCPAGKYGATTGLGTSTCSGNVGPGYWSRERADRVNPTNLASHNGERCPPGRFGAGGASSSSCSGPCQAGYYCPIGSGSATQTACGGPDKYCPTGSSSTTSVSTGYYTTPTAAATANFRSGQAQCEPGNSCNNGIRTPCAAGRFQATAGATSCSGTCNAGFFCPVGSSVGSAQPCGGPDKYCPAGRGTPITVSSGFYSTPESAPTTQRTGQARCAEDEFCSGGIRTKRITFPTRCTTPLGVNAFADTWSVDENDVAATVATLPFSKLGSDSMSNSLQHISSPAPAAGCPQSTADMNTMFDLVVSGGQAQLVLKSGQSFNFEECPFYALRIAFHLSTATLNPTFTCQVNVAVGDVNDPPKFKLDTRNGGGRFLRELYESARESSAVPVTKDDAQSDSRINSEDEDSGQELRYEIVGGMTDLSIGVCSGQLFVAQALSFERTAVYNFQVRITDNGVPPMSADYDVRVTVVDVNEPPVFQNTPYAFRVEENQPANFQLAGVMNSIVSAADEDTGAVLDYSMVVLDSDPNNPPFTLAATGGRLRTSRILDFEEAADPDGDGEREFRVIITVQDNAIAPGGPTFNVSTAAVVTLIDTNDPPSLLNTGSLANPQFTNLFHLDENTPAGQFVDTVRAADPDGNSIASMTLSGPHAANFAMTGSGTVWSLSTAGATYDYEALPALAKWADLTLTMTDDHPTDPRSAVVTVRVVIRNLNEVSTVTAGQSVSIPEDAAATFQSPALTATDPDNINDLSWNIVGGLFAISADGRISTGSVSLNFEATPSYTVQVSTTDSGNPSPSLTSALEDVTVTITNVNERPTITTTNFNLAENSAPGTVVGTLAVSDPDAGDSHTFSNLVGSGLMNPRDGSQQLFQLNPTTGALTVAPGVLTDPWRSGLDFEEGSVLELFATVSDAGNDGPVLTHTKKFTVTLTDVNEDPQIAFPQIRTILEEQPSPPVNVGPPVLVLDQENTTISCTPDTFVLTQGTFGINSGCQIASTTAVANIPDGTVFDENVTVTATDAQGNTHTSIVTISVVSSNTAPTINAQSLTWPEATLSTYNVTTEANDVDIGQTLSYFITQTSPSLASGWYVVDQSSGLLSSTPAVDFETLPAGNKDVLLTMVVQDDGIGQLTASATWTVSVTNVNEAPVIVEPPAFSIAETDLVPGADLSAAIGNLDATDVDGDMLTFTLTHLSGPPAYFAVDGTPQATPAQRSLTLSGTAVSHESRGALEPHVLTLTVTDNGTPALSVSRNITVQVLDVNEVPVLQNTPLDAFIIPEDTVLPGFPLPTNRRVSFQDTTGRASGGFITGSDPDTNDPTAFGSLEFTLMSNTDTFRIDNNGVLRVKDGVQLDYETIDRYDVQVQVCDRAPVPLCSSTETYEVLIRDEADIYVTDYNIESAQGGVVTSVPTDGGDVYIVFNGTDFGRQADVGVAAVTAVVTFDAGIDEGLSPVTVTDCTLVTRTSARCKHPAGYGVASWALTIRGTPAIPRIATATGSGSPTTTYTAPVLNTAVLDGANAPVSTEGGATVLFTGTNLGAGAPLTGSTVEYGPNTLFTMQSCVRVNPHTSIRCTLSPGWSRNLPFAIRIGGIQGTGLTSDISYADPSIANVTMSQPLSPTVGGPRITITGRNFAALGHGLLVGVGTPFDASRVSDSCAALAESDAVSKPHKFLALSCARSNSNPHRIVTCTMPAGSGTDLQLYVETFFAAPSGPEYVQRSEWSFNTVSYMPPTLSQVLGDGVFQANTEGGQLISVRGTNFGPAAPCQSVVTGDGNLQCTGVGDLRAGAPEPQQPKLEYARATEVDALGIAGARWFKATGCIVRDVGQLQCCSAPGTGGNFTYRVQVDGQWSEAPLLEPEASYHPPVVETYRVPGADANTPVESATRGGDIVRIVGLHFGADTTTLDSVRYGVLDNKEFESDVATCTMVVPHKQLDCITAPGAGADMSWIVTVDGQRSEVPSTSYGIPEVTGFGTPTTGMSTAGGERVVLLGNNFGPPVNASTRARMLAQGHVFLDWVKYGPVSGQEYTAAGCVVMSHTSIECITVPGSGSGLRWTVSVAGLVSDAPAFLWSYAEPTIGALVIDGTPTTAGGVIGTISGQNFAVQDPQTQLVVRVTLPFYSFARTPRYTEYMREQGWLDATDPEKWSVVTVGDTAPTYRDINVQGANSGGNDIVDFAIPEGVGTNISVQLLQVPQDLGMTYATFSAPVYFDYAPPGPPLGSSRGGFVFQTQDVNKLKTIITIKGSSLGRQHGTFYDGLLLLDREIVHPDRIQLWTHTEIKFEALRDGVLTDEQSSDNTTALNGGNPLEVFSENHFHVTIQVFDRVIVVPETEAVSVPGTPPSFMVNTFNASCNCTQQVLQDNSTIVHVPTGNVSEPMAQWHTSVEEIQGTSPGFAGRSGDLSPAPTPGNVSIQFRARNIGSDMSLLDVFVGENAILKGAMDGEARATAVPRDNVCAVTNIDYDIVTRIGEVTCTLPPGQGVTNRLSFVWNNKVPDVNSTDLLDDALIEYQSPTVSDVVATANASAFDPVTVESAQYTVGLGAQATTSQVRHYQFPTEGGVLSLQGANLGLTGGLAFHQYRTVDGTVAQPEHQFDGFVQTTSTIPQEIAYARTLHHSHTEHRVSIPPSMNLLDNVQYLLRYRHCGSVGCPEFVNARSDCATLAPGDSWAVGDVCDTPDQRIDGNTGFPAASDRDVRNTTTSIADSMISSYPNLPDTPVYISFSYLPAVIDIPSTTADSRTVGGGVLTVNGRNFGPADAEPARNVSVTVDGVDCPILRDVNGHRVTAPGVSAHRQIQCTMPPGSGRAVPYTVTIGSVTVTVPSSQSQVNYNPPVVTSMDRNTAPTDATDNNGGPITVTVTGDNFGSDPNRVVLRLLSNPVSVSNDEELNHDFTGAEVTLIDDTSLTFVVPEGSGAVKLLEITVSDQSTSDSMSVPLTGGTWPSDNSDLTVHAGQPWAPLVFRYNDPVLTGTSGDVSTRGGVLMLFGRNFGRFMDAGGNCLASSATVTLSTMLGTQAVSMQCDLAPFCGSQTHERLQCLVPPGVGANYDLLLQQSSRSALLAREFSYLPPVLEDVSPTPARADVAFEITLTGQNFGNADRSNVTVYIGGQLCLNARIEETDTTTLDVIKCQSQPQTVGPKSLNISVAFQEVYFAPTDGWVELNCPESQYGQVGEICQPCPAGGACAVHADPADSCLERIPNVGCNLYKEPIAAPEAWKFNLTLAEELCQRDARPDGFTEACPVMVGCDPPEACAGNNLCSTGYTGERCGLCELGFFRLDGECVRCPDLGWLFILLFIVGIFTVCGLGLLLNRYKVNLAFISIGVDYFQVLGLFARSKVQWPAIIKNVLSALSVFNLNLDLAAPECASPDLRYTDKWIAIMLLPLIIFSFFGLAHASKYVYKRWFKAVAVEKRNSHLPTLVSTSLLMFYLLYLYLTRTTFDMFNCSPTDPDDGHTYLEVVFERCWDSSTHKLLFPLAICTLVFYVLAYPALVFYILNKNKDSVKIDQLLRAKGLGDSRFESTNAAYDVRKSFSKLYYQFKPGKWYWQPVIVFRKFMIAVTSLFFRSTPSFQMALIVALLFFSFAAQVKQRPYMSSSEKRAEELYHEQKVLEGDPRHMKLDQSLKAVTRRISARGKKQNMDAIKKTAERAPAAQFVTNFNTIETTLLTCAILVAMAAVLFESRRLKNGSSPAVREALVWITLLIIFGSIVYFLVVAFIEIFDTVAPTMFASCCKCCKAKKSTIELEAERGMAGMKAAQPDDAATAINPMLAGSMAGSKAMSADEIEAIMAMLRSGQTPNHPQWQAIRTHMLRQRSEVADMTNEIRVLKKAATVRSAKASLSSDSEDRKKRRPKGAGKQRSNFKQSSTRRSTVGRAGPGISKTSANRMRGAARGDNVLG